MYPRLLGLGVLSRTIEGARGQTTKKVKTLNLTTWGSEANLVRKASRGDLKAFDELALRYRPTLYAMAYRMLRNAEDATDAVQETLIKAFRAIGEFDSQRPIKPWLCRICGNCCVDIVRQRRHRAESLDQHEFMLCDPTQEIETRATDSLRHEAIVEAIDRLPTKYQRILWMRHYRHMDVAEIAEELGTPEGTVKSWLFRARTMLKKDLQPIMASI